MGMSIASICISSSILVVVLVSIEMLTWMKSQGITKVSTIDPVGNMYIFAKFHGDSSNSS